MMRCWGRWHVALRGTWFGLPERGNSSLQELTSVALAELWIPRTRQGQAVLQDNRWDTHIPVCLSVLHNIQQHASPTSAWTVSVQGDAFLRELRQIRHVLRQIWAWPFRYWFSPVARSLHPTPLFSRRKLPTGLMEAGYQVCHINRNWDGIDRLDDLSLRDEFLDAAGTVYIVRQSLWAYLGSDLDRWISMLCRGHWGEIELQFVPGQETQETWLEQIMARAERWRTTVGLPDYAIHRKDDVEKQWQQLLLQRTPFLGTALDIAAYVAEMMRTHWGGEYRAWTPEDQTGTTLPFQAPGSKTKQPSNLPVPEPNVVLKLPWEQTVAPLHKAIHALFEKRKFAWPLQIDVLAAHRRQGFLLEQLGQELFSSHPTRVRGTLRLLWHIADLRVEEMLAQRLLLEQDPLHLCVILERLEQAPKRLQARTLGDLAQHPHPAVVARVLWLLFLRKDTQTPELIDHLTQQDTIFALRPLAHHVLTHTTGDRQLAKRVLRKLGPAPPVRSDDDLFPPKPGVWEPLPGLSEILEDCANPNKQKIALQILEDWPDLSELDTLGHALANPNPVERMQVMGLLSGSDQPRFRDILRTRLLFETDPLCRAALQSILAN